MKIREEDCNLVLLTVVTFFALAIAGGANLVGASAHNPVQLADRTGARSEPVPVEKPLAHVADQSQVRVVGAPFAPNTKPSER